MKRQLVLSTMFIALLATFILDMISKSKLFKAIDASFIQS